MCGVSAGRRPMKADVAGVGLGEGREALSCLHRDRAGRDPLGDKHPPLGGVRQWGAVTNGVGPDSGQRDRIPAPTPDAGSWNVHASPGRAAPTPSVYKISPRRAVERSRFAGLGRVGAKREQNPLSMTRPGFSYRRRPTWEARPTTFGVAAAHNTG